MEEISIFPDKETFPSDPALRLSLKTTYRLWKELSLHVMALYPEGKADWNYPGKKYG